MSSGEEENGGRAGPDNYLDALITDLAVTALYNPEMVGLKVMALVRYAVLLQFQNDFNYSITVSMIALDSVLQSALTQVGSQYSDFAILRNVTPEIQAKGLGAMHNNYVRKPKKHIR